MTSRRNNILLIITIVVCGISVSLHGLQWIHNQKKQESVSWYKAKNQELKRDVSNLERKLLDTGKLNDEDPVSSLYRYQDNGVLPEFGFSFSSETDNGHVTCVRSMLVNEAEIDEWRTEYRLPTTTVVDGVSYKVSVGCRANTGELILFASALATSTVQYNPPHHIIVSSEDTDPIAYHVLDDSIYHCGPKDFIYAKKDPDPDQYLPEAQYITDIVFSCGYGDAGFVGETVSLLNIALGVSKDLYSCTEDYNTRIVEVGDAWDIGLEYTRVCKAKG